MKTARKTQNALKRVNMAPANKGFDVSWIILLTIAIAVAIIAVAFWAYSAVQEGGINAGKAIDDTICNLKKIVGAC